MILHAEDVGLMEEANRATIDCFDKELVQSASCMVPCPAFEAFAEWARNHNEKDIGLHLTLTSEWPHYRWRPVAPPEMVPSLVDSQGYLKPDIDSLLECATAEEVEIELRAQVEKAISSGIRPTHLDSHMGVVFRRPDLLDVYFRLAEEYKILALSAAVSKRVIEQFRERKVTISKDMSQQIAGYDMPKADDYLILPCGRTYEEKRSKFLDQVRGICPGITLIVFHPCSESESMKRKIFSWEQRVWEGRLLSDPLVVRFFQEQDLIFTDWREIVRRYRDRALK